MMARQADRREASANKRHLCCAFVPSSTAPSFCAPLASAATPNSMRLVAVLSC